MSNRRRPQLKQEVNSKMPYYDVLYRFYEAGPKGVWCHHKRKNPTKIHVNQHFIKVNGKRIKEDPLMTPDQLIPVVTLKQTNRNDMGYQMVIDGPCSIVYKPYKPLPCGAHLWIETYKPVQFVDTQFNSVTARRPYKDVS
ncbi:hypothetical protein [Dapis sp. BLCC M172]